MGAAGKGDGIGTWEIVNFRLYIREGESTQ